MKVLAIGETRDVRSGWGRYAHEVLSQLEKENIDYDFIEKSDLQAYSLVNHIKNILHIRKRVGSVSLIHSFDVWPFAVYALFANLGIDKPLFITGVGTYSLPPKNGLKGYLMKKTYARAREIFCISNYTREVIKDRGAVGNFQVVHWGTTELPSIMEAEKQDFAKQFGVNLNNRPIILTVGQIKSRKGQLDTLKAIGILKNKYPNILYITVGSTADKAYVKEMREYSSAKGLEKNFLIVDTQKTDKELAFFYSICDIFTMNSNNEEDHFEGFGLVFLEAAQFGKPLVGSRDCGIEDAISDGKTGFLTNQGDVNDIAKKIDMALSNKEELGRAAQSRVKEFTWEKTVDRYLQSYKSKISS
ncbi:MAG: hypothetical protein A2920_02730 [Candidatus Zambryskibacteria bacterium RIFCSPLOWO2_01_FULL_43_17]|uniref:Glycosyl transferase family 1 domain-containing protein n=1 Tax=Candidatus Zambryskibacteria bacterium RIFCSPLOWO2_01_FULL_43_17 TaxID=1802760 RepID=A0A1G2U231_9BACT|nr:MAG: hypothetical protein A2920_02730 [Candidatus Zambryskibacteria bacterium RIFCSPLOWO2_01_FULL_43_17]